VRRIVTSLDHLILLVLFISLTLLPLPLTQWPYLLWILTLMSYYTILAMNWNLLLGYSRLLSFAHTGLLAVGGYGSVFFTLMTSLPPIMGVIFGSVLASIVGLILGWICLRLKGMYLALATWGFSGTVQLLIISEYHITGGTKGISTQFLLPMPSFKAPIYYYYAALTFLFICVLTTYKLIYSKYGLFLRAIGDDEDAASACGVHIIWLRILVFTFSSFWIGLAGAFYVHFLGYASPAIADFLTVMVVVMASTILGGLGSFFGPILGSFVVWPLSEFIRAHSASLQMIILAVVLLLSLKFFRNGFVGAVSSLYYSTMAKLRK